MRVKFFGLDRQYQEHREKFLEIAERVWSSGKVLQGDEVKSLEAYAAERFGRKRAVAVGSATDALAFALEAAGVGEGDEVIVNALTFIASASAILRVGASPPFADVENDYYQIDFDRAEKLVTPKTKAIIAVHLYGQTFSMARAEAFADKHGLVLVEDAAQAVGAYDGERPAGSLGIASCLSFDPTKVVGSFSGAGLFLTDDDGVAKKATMARYHGRDPETRRIVRLGFNSQLASDMAGMLEYKLRQLPDWLARRDEIAERYKSGLADIDDLELPKTRPGSTHNWHKFVLRAERRDELKAFLKEREIDTMIHYARPVCDEPLFAELGLPEEARDVPVARRLGEEVLTLPLYPELRDEEVDYVVEAVKEFYK